MEAIDCIKSRKSTRKFLDKDVDIDKLGIILDCGMAAPSAGNLQSWKFILVKQKEQRDKIAEAAVQQYWIAQAPAIIVVCSEDEKVKSFYGLRGERLYTVQNSAGAAENMILAAHALGLSSCWVSAFDEGMLKRYLNIPEGVRPQVILPIGYAAEKPKEQIRHHMENMVSIENYGSRFTDAAVDVMEEYHLVVKRGITHTKKILNAVFDKLKGK